MPGVASAARRCRRCTRARCPGGLVVSKRIRSRSSSAGPRPDRGRPAQSALMRRLRSAAAWTRYSEMPVPRWPSQSYSVSALVDVREAPVAALAQRRDLDAPGPRAASSRPLRVGRARARSERWQPSSGSSSDSVSQATIGASSPSRIRKPPAVSPPSLDADVVEHQEVVGVDDHAEPAPVGHALPVAHAPGVVAHARARRAGGGGRRPRSRPRPSRAARSARSRPPSARPERNESGLAPGGEAQARRDTATVSVGVASVATCSARSNRRPAPSKRSSHSDQRQARTRTRPGPPAIVARRRRSRAKLSRNPWPGQPDAERALGDALVRPPPDARVEGEARGRRRRRSRRSPTTAPRVPGCCQRLVRGGDARARRHGVSLPPVRRRRYLRLLAPLEQVLADAQHDHERREEDHQAEAEVRDDLVVGLAVEALAALGRQRRAASAGRRRQADQC